MILVIFLVFVACLAIKSRIGHARIEFCQNKKSSLRFIFKWPLSLTSFHIFKQQLLVLVFQKEKKIPENYYSFFICAHLQDGCRLVCYVNQSKIGILRHVWDVFGMCLGKVWEKFGLGHV